VRAEQKTAPKKPPKKAQKQTKKPRKKKPKTKQKKPKQPEKKPCPHLLNACFQRVGKKRGKGRKIERKMQKIKEINIKNMDC
jgi:hypothetical protein